MDTNRKILVSGTPVQNDLKEFYTLADFVNPGILGNPSSKFSCWIDISWQYIVILHLNFFWTILLKNLKTH